LELFGNIPKIRRVLQTLADVGLDYVALGQAAPTLSGGEAQRVKLAAELSRPNTGRTLYILDEPTTGLHFDDIRKLLTVLNRLVDLGNTVIVVEHNLDVIKTADWIIDLGPEGGNGGGLVVAAGTPEDLAIISGCHTATFLAPVLAAGPRAERLRFDPSAIEKKEHGDVPLEQVGKDSAMPWQTDGKLWHTDQRLSHRGKPCRWDGRIVTFVEGLIRELGDFAQTDWNHPTTVEIAARVKSLGWFFHAHTGMEWLTRLIFRVAKNTFKQEELDRRLGIPTLDDTEGVEVYGSEPRVHVANRKGPWQEVWMLVHRMSEIDTPAFRQFLSQAMLSFQKNLTRMQTKPEDVMPWKVNGERWHLGEKGFPPGRKLQWQRSVLSKLLDLVRAIEPKIEIRWDNRAFIGLRVPGVSRAWAQWRTKDSCGLDCRFLGKKGQFNLSQVDNLGLCPRIAGKNDGDLLHLVFQHENHMNLSRLKEVLGEHLKGFRETFG
jgi:excinuclease ABC subunit A